MITFQELLEKTLTPAEKKKREEIAKAMEKDNPDMPMDKKMAIATATAKRVAESDFEPHMMYDPNTGKSEKAEKPEDHERLKKKGYTHEKPEVKEGKYKVNIKGEGGATVQARSEKEAIAKVMKQLGIANRFAKDRSFMKKISVLGETVKEKPEVKEAKSSSGYELYHRDFSGAMQHAYAHAKKKGFIVDKDDIDSKVAMGPKRPSSGKTNRYILDTNKKQKLHVQVANLDNKRYELNMYIESVESLDESVISDVKDIVAKKQAKKIQGVMVDMFTASAISQIYDKVNDANKAKMDKLKITKLADLAMKLMKREDFVTENTRAKRDAMRAMGKRGIDPADVDITATDDDRKAASKNVLMQIRKATDLPKGGDLEFPSGKKGKISQDDAKKIDRLFNMLKRPADKEKFQKVISKDLNSIKGLLRKLGR